MLGQMISRWKVLKSTSKLLSAAEGMPELAIVVNNFGNLCRQNIFQKTANLKIIAERLSEDHADTLERYGLTCNVEFIKTKLDEFEKLYNERASYYEANKAAVANARAQAVLNWELLVDYINGYQAVYKVDFEGFSNEISNLYLKAKTLSPKKTTAKADGTEAASADEPSIAPTPDTPQADEPTNAINSI